MTFVAGESLPPDGSMKFLGSAATVHIGADEAAYVTANATFGSTAGAGNLSLYVCSAPTPPGTTLTTHGFGEHFLSALPGSRTIMGLSAAFTEPVGNYLVGLCGKTSDSNTNWDGIANGYTSVLVASAPGGVPGTG
jgi:hypothetical protein